MNIVELKQKLEEYPDEAELLIEVPGTSAVASHRTPFNWDMKLNAEGRDKPEVVFYRADNAALSQTATATATGG